MDDRDSVIHARRLVHHTSFEDANHAPSVSVAERIDVIATAGDTVTLTATGEEHDGDELTYRW